MKFLDETGLAYLWTKLKSLLNNKADRETTEQSLSQKQDKINTWGDLLK